MDAFLFPANGLMDLGEKKKSTAANSAGHTVRIQTLLLLVLHTKQREGGRGEGALREKKKKGVRGEGWPLGWVSEKIHA